MAAGRRWGGRPPRSSGGWTIGLFATTWLTFARSRPPGETFELPGNGHLWAAIPADGRIVARPRGSPGMPKLNDDGSITTKVLWMGRLSSKTRKRNLTIKGERLDGKGRSFKNEPKPGSWNGEALYWPGS